MVRSRAAAVVIVIKATAETAGTGLSLGVVVDVVAAVEGLAGVLECMLRMMDIALLLLTATIQTMESLVRVSMRLGLRLAT